MEEIFLVVLFLDLFLNMFLGGGVVCAGAVWSEKGPRWAKYVGLQSEQDIFPPSNAAHEHPAKDQARNLQQLIV
jgi:hypothetical protein